MKQAILILAMMVAALVAAADNAYEVAAFYEVQELPRGSKVIDNYNNVKEAKSLLVPVELDKGTYEVKVTRVDTNLYKVEFNYTDYFYIETKYCYHSAYRDEAVLIVNSRYDYKKGSLVFR